MPQGIKPTIVIFSVINMSTPKFSLSNVLFDGNIQIDFIRIFQHVINKIPETVDIVLYSSNHDYLDTRPTKKHKRKEKDKNNAAKILTEYERETKHSKPIQNVSHKHEIEQIHAHFNKICAPPFNILQLIWAVLFIFYISDDMKNIVRACTPLDIARNFFDSEPYNELFESLFFGHIVHKKKDKKNTEDIPALSQQAKTPTEMTVYFLCLFNSQTIKN